MNNVFDFRDQLVEEYSLFSRSDGEVLKLRVQCKKDATSRLDERIPYGLAVTMEVKDEIPVYEQIRERIRPRVRAARV